MEQNFAMALSIFIVTSPNVGDKVITFFVTYFINKNNFYRRYVDCQMTNTFINSFVASAPKKPSETAPCLEIIDQGCQ